MFASELLQAAATELNDLESGAEYTRFPQAELIGYLNEALAQLAIAKPTLFRTLTTLTLGQGAQQLLPDSVESVEDIIFNVNPDGSLGAPILPGAFNLERTYGKGVCATEPYSVRSFASLPSSDQFYFVDPPVPPGATVRVQALVTLAPQTVTTPETPIDLPNASPVTYRNHLKDYMLYRAFAKDTESQTSAANSAAHFKAFYQAVGNPPRTKKALPLSDAEKQDAPTIE